MISSLSLLVCAWLVCVVGVQAECLPVVTHYGNAPGDYFGGSVAGIGDIDGDGFGDYAISKRDKVHLFSGLTNDSMHVLDVGRWVAAAGDVNNDGWPDIIVGGILPNYIGVVRVFSGHDFGLLHEFQGEFSGDAFGNAASSAGDFNQDGYDDIMIGAFLYSGSGPSTGKVYIFSGHTSDTLFTLDGGENDYLGKAAVLAGDVNGDAHDDIVITSVNECILLSGFTADTIYVLNIPGIRAASSAGDVNGDGYADFAIGGAWYDWLHGNSYWVFVVSGQSGDVLYEWWGPWELWSPLAGVGDMNGDGYDDLLVGVPYHFEDTIIGYLGQAIVYSGRTGFRLHTITGPEPWGYLGAGVAGIGDVDGDGLADIIIGAPEDGPSAPGKPDPGPGRAYIYHGRQSVCGDANGDLLTDVLDIEFLQAHYFECNSAPCDLTTSDLNCDESIDIADIVFLSEYVFGTGSEPCCVW